MNPNEREPRERIKWNGPVTLRGRYDGVVREIVVRSPSSRARRSSLRKVGGLAKQSAVCKIGEYSYHQLRHDMTLLNGRLVSFYAPSMLRRLLDEIDPGEFVEIQYTGKTIRSGSGRPVKEFIVNRLQPPRTPADKIARGVATLKVPDDDELESLLSPVDPMPDERGRTEDPPGPLADAEHDTGHRVVPAVSQEP